MPLQLYEKEQILDACLAMFALHGYKNTSTAMLAEAAGVSKALLFHHFKSKRELYLSVLDRCFDKGAIEMGFETLLEHQDFFEAKEKLSILKFDYLKKNFGLYKFVKEAFYDTPEELRIEIEEKYGTLIATRDKALEHLFEKVPLRDGVDRNQAFKLVMITLEYFETKYLADITDARLDETYLRTFLEERNNFLDMIRYGIEK